jgi:hypothetical protein
MLEKRIETFIKGCFVDNFNLSRWLVFSKFGKRNETYSAELGG